MNSLEQTDTQIFNLIIKEKDRQEQELTLIASENYTSCAVRKATGSILTNKYAEGYPGKRYYAGCHIVDEVEQLAIDRCKKLFGAEHVNVQPHAGSQANMAAYFAVLKPGDTLMGMNLAAGGHLTHGHKVNFSGLFYNVIQYGVNKETEQLDFDEISNLAQQHKPKLIICGASAYSRTIDFSKFKQIADSIGAYFLADIAHIAGLVATGHHPTPVGHADLITSTTHKTLRGPRAGIIMTKTEFAQTIDRAIIPGLQGGPLLHTIAAKAVAFQEALAPEFSLYQEQVIRNAQTMAQALQEKGYRIVTDGTDNHLFIVDLRNKGVNGLIVQNALEQAGIIASRSCIPFDPEKPWVTSGIRFGTPAMTTRGMKEVQAQEIAQLIDEVIMQHDNVLVIKRVKEKVNALCNEFSVDL